MRKDHRPYTLKKLYLRFQKVYTQHFLKPQFKHLGEGFIFFGPWHIELFGAPIVLGKYANVIATPDQKIRLAVWPEQEGKGKIHIGNYCLICPGVRISAADEISIGDNCMIASNAYITDSDWHDIYNRISIGRVEPIKIEENVWIGDSTIICKGVHIGKNSIIGAGAVVVDDIPADSIAAGNPAKIVKRLNPQEQFSKRSQWFANPDQLFHEIDQLDREKLMGNSYAGWLRSIIRPNNYD